MARCGTRGTQAAWLGAGRPSEVSALEMEAPTGKHSFSVRTTMKMSGAGCEALPLPLPPGLPALSEGPPQAEVEL